jgi:uncharacterized protein (TIGR03067 family)
MKILYALLAGVLTLLFAAPAVVRGGDDAKKETATLQGKWKPTKIEGRNPLKLDGLLVTVRGDKLTLEGATEKPLEFTFKLDPAAKPKAIDVTFELGTLLGVYELDGDVLKVCYSELQESEKGRRPTEFATPADSKRYLWVLKREK